LGLANIWGLQPFSPTAGAVSARTAIRHMTNAATPPFPFPFPALCTVHRDGQTCGNRDFGRLLQCILGEVTTIFSAVRQNVEYGTPTPLQKQGRGTPFSPESYDKSQPKHGNGKLSAHELRVY